MSYRILFVCLLVAVCTVFYGCTFSAKSGTEGDIGVVINLEDRELQVFKNGLSKKAYPVSVGKSTHPTPKGHYEIFQIDWNPDWTPLDSDWSEDANYKPPGHEDNPMGRVRMVYLPPYTIHGTTDLLSLGEA